MSKSKNCPICSDPHKVLDLAEANAIIDQQQAKIAMMQAELERAWSLSRTLNKLTRISVKDKNGGGNVDMTQGYSRPGEDGRYGVEIYGYVIVSEFEGERMYLSIGLNPSQDWTDDIKLATHFVSVSDVWRAMRPWRDQVTEVILHSVRVPYSHLFRRQDDGGLITAEWFKSIGGLHDNETEPPEYGRSLFFVDDPREIYDIDGPRRMQLVLAHDGTVWLETYGQTGEKDSQHLTAIKTRGDARAFIGLVEGKLPNEACDTVEGRDVRSLKYVDRFRQFSGEEGFIHRVNKKDSGYWGFTSQDPGEGFEWRENESQIIQKQPKS